MRLEILRIVHSPGREIDQTIRIMEKVEAHVMAPVPGEPEPVNASAPAAVPGRKK